MLDEQEIAAIKARWAGRPLGERGYLERLKACETVPMVTVFADIDALVAEVCRLRALAHEPSDR